METIVLSKVMWIVLFVTALGVYLNFKDFLHMIDECSHQSSLIVLTSFLRLIVGSLILALYNNWTGGIAIIISILGWIILLAGVSGMLFPKKLMMSLPYVSKHPDWLTAIVVLFGALGLLLMYVGFVG